jgi:hypothetical protein
VRLAARLGDLQLELAAQVVGDRDQRGGASRDETSGLADARVGADVPHVAPMGRDDERRARRQSGREPGRDEEVRIDHVRTEAACGAGGLRGKAEMTPLAAAAAVEHGPFDFMPPVGQRALDLDDEGTEVRVVRPRVHLRDEQDLQTTRARVLAFDHRASAVSTASAASTSPVASTIASGRGTRFCARKLAALLAMSRSIG